MIQIHLRRNIKNIVNWKHSNHPHTWHPPTDLYETEEHYIVRVEVAGMNKEEFCVNLEEDRLDISGSRPDLAVKSGLPSNGDSIWEFSVNHKTTIPCGWQPGDRRIS